MCAPTEPRGGRREAAQIVDHPPPCDLAEEAGADEEEALRRAAGRRHCAARRALGRRPRKRTIRASEKVRLVTAFGDSLSRVTRARVEDRTEQAC